MADPSLDRKSVWLNEGLKRMWGIDSPYTSRQLVEFHLLSWLRIVRDKTARLFLSDLDRFLGDYLTPTGVKVHLGIYPCYFGTIGVV